MNSIKDFYVSKQGSDKNPGTYEQPFATIEKAQTSVRQIIKNEMCGNINVYIREGTYYLNSPLVFGPDDSGKKNMSVVYASYAGEKTTISGGKRLTCRWKPFRDGIMMCELPDVREGKLDFDQLFVNGQRQTLARYPNYDNCDPGKSGYIYAKAPLTDDIVHESPEEDDDMKFSGAAPRGVYFDPETFTKRKWENLQEKVIHIYQAMYWGNLQWQIKDIDYERNILWFGRGGVQMGAKYNRNPCMVNQKSRFFIENIFEELDAPGEWYLAREQGILYFLPTEDIDLTTAVIEVPVLKRIIEMKGEINKNVRNITLSGFRFAHTQSTFLDVYNIPSLGDWAIHRGGTLYLENTRNCTVEESFFDQVGGNAVFINNHNREVVVKNNLFIGSGDSAVCVVGTEYMTVGSQRMFPYECEISNNLIHDCGIFGKQVAGVFISIAKRITVGHNTIYNMPRAGICINDGSWGGHIIEYNKIHDTCLETADHGSFNSWGRDRYWCLLHSHGPTGDEAVCHQAGDIFVDQMETVIIRHNFFKEKSGWGLDLDDGASNYHIYNNLCVGVSMKLREGAYRLIENNIWVKGANSPCFHVGNTNNHDRYLRNITVMSTKHSRPENDTDFEMGAHYGEMYTLIKPPNKGPWLETIDYNLFYNDLGYFKARAITGEGGSGKKLMFNLEEWQKLGFDENSIFADPMFVDPEIDDYRVKPESPALKIGFQNFEMDNFGLLSEFPQKWLNK